jgi:hypothetical protein
MSKKQTIVYRSILGRFFPYPQQIVLGILFTILSGLMVVVMGNIYSDFQTSYLIETKQPQMVVLNTYDGKFIIGTIASGSNNLLTNKYQVVDPSGISFSTKNIDQLSTVKQSARPNGGKFLNSVYTKIKHFIT